MAEKTYHRWTQDEDKALLAFVRDNASAYNSIGQPGGVAREVFWGQAPGKLGIMITPLACSMRYRTLTSSTDWARKRRKEETRPKLVQGSDEPSRVEFDSLAQELREMKQLMSRLLRVWEGDEPAAQPQERRERRAS